MKKPKTKRLPKGPISKQDFVVEETWGNQERVEYQWYDMRSDARVHALHSAADRVRVFKVSYELIQDRKKK